MTTNEYQRLAMRTSPRDGHDKMDNAVLGLIGETGEIVDEYKKFIYQSKPGTELPAQKFAKETGDVMWHIAELADGMEICLGDAIGNDFGAFDEETRERGTLPSVRNAVLELHRIAHMILISVEQNMQKMIRRYMQEMMQRIAEFACIIGYDTEQIAEMNIAKLKKRYPNGFDAGISMERYENEK